MIHGYIHGLSDWEKLFYLFIYRTYYSSQTALEQMTGTWMHDCRNLKFLNIEEHIDARPYTFRLRPASGIKDFLISVSLPILKDFWHIFEGLNETSILEVEEELFRLFSLRTGRPVKLLSSILANDISLSFPDKVNPNSECYISLSARQGLRMLSGKRNDDKIDCLREQTGLNYSSLNRALSVWSKYMTRKEYYEKTGDFKEDWLIKAL